MAVRQITTIQRFEGLSTDAKPTVDVELGSIFYETDTESQFIFTDAGWVQEAQPVVLKGSLARLPYADYVTSQNTVVAAGATYNDADQDFSGYRRVSGTVQGVTGTSLNWQCSLFALFDTYGSAATSASSGSSLSTPTAVLNTNFATKKTFIRVTNNNTTNSLTIGAIEYNAG